MARDKKIGFLSGLAKKMFSTPEIGKELRTAQQRVADRKVVKSNPFGGYMKIDQPPALNAAGNLKTK